MQISDLCNVTRDTAYVLQLIDSQFTICMYLSYLGEYANHYWTIMAKLSPAKTIIQAFITCRELDYCNSQYGVSDYLLQKVQSVQNAAARLIT